MTHFERPFSFREYTYFWKEIYSFWRRDIKTTMDGFERNMKKSKVANQKELFRLVEVVLDNREEGKNQQHQKKGRCFKQEPPILTFRKPYWGKALLSRG